VAAERPGHQDAEALAADFPAVAVRAVQHAAAPPLANTGMSGSSSGGVWAGFTELSGGLLPAVNEAMPFRLVRASANTAPYTPTSMGGGADGSVGDGPGRGEGGSRGSGGSGSGGSGSGGGKGEGIVIGPPSAAGWSTMSVRPRRA